MATDSYVPVIDISQHQGAVDFGVMLSKGVDGLIIRSNHAQVVDKHCARYVTDARAAGWRDDQFGFYTFCNPKRATGAASGKAFVDTVRSVFGRTDTLLMLDIEGYETESGAGPVIKGAQFAGWIREHIDTVHTLAPDCTLIAYSNAAFWNPWVGDQLLAAELDWIVPRYPVYPPATVRNDAAQLAAWILKSPKPPTPDQWAEWAFSKAPGPFPPAGAKFDGWQFSAGWNRQGPVYGCQSSDLDLNIVRASAWERWTRRTTEPEPPDPLPIVEEDMKAIVYTVNTTTIGGAWFYVSPEGTVRQIRNVPEKDDWVAAGAIERNAESVEAFVNEMLPTFRPLGALSVQGKNVLGPEASATWAARASVTPAASGGPAPKGFTGSISLTPMT